MRHATPPSIGSPRQPISSASSSRRRIIVFLLPVPPLAGTSQGLTPPIGRPSPVASTPAQPSPVRPGHASRASRPHPAQRTGNPAGPSTPSIYDVPWPHAPDHCLALARVHTQSSRPFVTGCRRWVAPTAPPIVGRPALQAVQHDRKHGAGRNAWRQRGSIRHASLVPGLTNAPSRRRLRPGDGTIHHRRPHAHTGGRHGRDRGGHIRPLPLWEARHLPRCTGGAGRLCRLRGRGRWLPWARSGI